MFFTYCKKIRQTSLNISATKISTAHKCNFCIDRINAGLTPACVKACSTGALQFGEKSKMLHLAHDRVSQLGKDAMLYLGEDYSIFWAFPDKALIKHIE
ncbi:MAG: hypothetical protein J7K96_04335 [Desulfobacteraceae bacterium]|nr:hypothetical protein [Desulfobacteraceae bacterium]